MNSYALFWECNTTKQSVSFQLWLNVSSSLLGYTMTCSESPCAIIADL